MKKILLTTVVCVGLGMAASAQQKKTVGKTKQTATASKATKTEPKDELAARRAEKLAYLNQNKSASTATAPAKAALTRD